MTAFYHQLLHRSLAQADALLGPGDGRRGLDGGPENHGHSIGNAAKNTARVVGHRADLPIVNGKGIVALAAAQIGGFTANAKFHGFHGRHAVNDLGNPAFHTAEHRLPQSGRHSGDVALDDAADTVTIRPCLGNFLPHPRPGIRGENGKIVSDQIQLGVQGIHLKIIFYSGNGCNPRGNANAPFRQPLFAQPSRDAQGRRQPPGEMPAACRVLKAAILDLSSVVRVSRAGAVAQVGVVTGAGVCVVNDGGNGRAAGKAIQNPRQEIRAVLLLPGGGPAILPRRSSVQKCL